MALTSAVSTRGAGDHGAAPQRRQDLFATAALEKSDGDTDCCDTAILADAGFGGLPRGVDYSTLVMFHVDKLMSRR